MTDTSHPIVVLGAGFGGLAFVRALKKAGVCGSRRVVVIDRADQHLFTPLLYEVATGFVEHENIGSAKLLGTGVTVANSSLFARLGADFMCGKVVGIDHAAKTVQVEGMEPVPYSHLVIALGAEPNYFGIPGLKEHSFALKTVREADRLRQRLHDMLHKREAGKRDHLDIVIGGAGPTGVELAAEITMFFKQHMVKGHLKPEDFTIHLVEAQSRVLAALPSDASAYALERLRALGITVHLDSAVKEVGPRMVTLVPRACKPGETPDKLLCDFTSAGSMTIDADLVIWTGGIRGSSALESFGIPLDARGKRIEVGPDFAVAGLKDVYAIGDATVMMNPDTKLPVPWLAQAALDQGSTLAQIIIAALRGDNAPVYRFKTFAYAVPLGGKCAYVHAFGMTFRGTLGWCMKELSVLRYFLSIMPLSDAVSHWYKGAKMYSGND